MPVFRLTDELIFPDPRWAAGEGLLAVGGDLSPQRLVLAYTLGIFPWYGDDEPIMWWSPDPRCVLIPENVYVSRRLERVIRQGRFRLTCNRAFAQVVEACADVRTSKGEETWLIAEMQAAYQKLHELGFAHSVEAWCGERLVGGLYGVALGKFFFGESMFHAQPNASKVILAQLARHLETEGFALLDCQVPNPHLISMGACHIAREDFLQRLVAGGLRAGCSAEKVVLPGML
ncbi:MAG: leucyl/phenylalanyl-tRNA--protein transferase [Desulfuromonadales bacterium]|jgi:leucyl/phenylalanyl-tRNA--protein transferase|nr:leucyl/phenylalanyl-tRNA--protein transferase [Desulfuromonadales bacterium]